MKNLKQDRDYVVLFQLDGEPYHMSWPSWDIDPDSPTYGKHLSTEEVMAWVWAWIDQEAKEHHGFVRITYGHHESRSVRVTSISQVDVLDHNKWHLVA